jgi:hypothetical protein
LIAEFEESGHEFRSQVLPRYAPGRVSGIVIGWSVFEIGSLNWKAALKAPQDAGHLPKGKFLHFE